MADIDESRPAEYHETDKEFIEEAAWQKKKRDLRYEFGELTKDQKHEILKEFVIIFLELESEGIENEPIRITTEE